MSKSVYSNLDKKEKQAYKKMQKEHTKTMIKLAKEDRDFDWGYLHDLVITKIRHMYEYFSNGNNVMQTDDTRIPICAQLNHILQLQDEVDHLYDDMPVADWVKNADNSYTIKSSEEVAKESIARHNKESELYKSIYKFIGEHIEEWWD